MVAIRNSLPPKPALLILLLAIFLLSWETSVQAIEIVGTTPLFPGGHGVAISGDHAYVAKADINLGSGMGEFRVLDVSNPASPALRGSCMLPYGGQAVAISGDHAFVATADGGAGYGSLEVIDISDPMSPTVVGHADLIFGGYGVATYGNIAYVALAAVSDGGPDAGGLAPVDISVLTNPILIQEGVAELRYGAHAVVISGHHAYVAEADVETMGYDSGCLQVFDVGGDPYFSPPPLAGEITLVNGGRGLAISGDHAYLALADIEQDFTSAAPDDGDFVVIGILDPSDPQVVGSCSLWLGGQGVTISDDRAYVAEADLEDFFMDPLDTGRFEVIDISNPSNPQSEENLALELGGHAVAVVGNHAYIAEADIEYLSGNIDNGSFQVVELWAPRIWHVPVEAPTIAAALDLAAYGDTIVVACDTYYEHDIVMKSGIFLRSETGEPDCVTIDAQSLGRIIYCANVDDATTIEGFTFTGGIAENGGGIYCTQSSPGIVRCVFNENQSVDNGGGIACYDGSSPAIEFSTFTGNSAGDVGGAVFCRDDCNPALVSCTLEGNSAATAGGGIGTWATASPTVESTIIAASPEGSAVHCESGSGASLSCCDVHGNEGGDWVGHIADQYGLSGNFSEDPLFCDPENGDLSLANGSPCAPGNISCGLIGAWPVGCSHPVSFTEIAVEWAEVSSGSLAWGDYDDDGDLDLALIGYSAGGLVRRVYRNDGGGVFSDIYAFPTYIGIFDGMVAWSDYDNDGDLDVAMTGENTNGFEQFWLYRNTGGAFSQAEGFGTDVHARSSCLDWGDYDMDGDLDLVIAGNSTLSGRFTRVFRNDGGVLTNIDAGLTGVSACWVGWADYDSDADLDLLVTGDTSSGLLLRLYRNDAGAFINASAGLTAVKHGSGAWGDYDADGDLDLVLSGMTDSGNVTRVYRNDAGIFVDAVAGLPGLVDCSVGWGDVDNDGDLDLAISGYTGTEYLSRIYCCTSIGFQDMGIDLPPLRWSAVAWGDYDADGDSDLALAGYTGSGYAAHLFDSSGAPANTPPVSPTGLAAEWDGERVTLSWDAASDAETPSAGLSYNLRVGTTPGGGEICSPMANTASGYRHIVHVGNAQARTSWTLRVLDTGPVYWSVQAVDGAFAGSPFAPESETWPPPPEWADATNDPLGETLGDPGQGFGVAWGDYDADGDLDLYVVNHYDQADKLLHNEGDGSFSDATSALPMGDPEDGVGAAWGDYDNDGDLDLYVSNWNAANVLFANDGDGTFSDATLGLLGETANTRGVAWGDYDNDGDLDLYLANYAGPNRLLHNEGDGTFTDATNGDPLSNEGNGAGVAWGDYDSDGDLDLYLANDGQADKLFRNEGDGTFTDATIGELIDETGNSLGVAWGDYDNDGDLDLYIANYQTNKLFRNEGSGSFTDIASGPLADAGYSRGMSWGDYDNDGDLDLYIANDGQPNRLLRNEDGGSFVYAESTLLGDMGSGRGVAWGDYDNDGDLDLYVVNGGANKLFSNQSAGGANRWLQVKLIGTDSNRSGIGARVRLVSGGLSQIREVSGGSGYFSQNSLPVEFGLGSASVVDSLRIYWPSGTVQDIASVSVDQILVITESDGSTSVQGDSAPTVYKLFPCFPNPFNPMTTIRYDLPRPSRVSLHVYDLAGRLVKTLLAGEMVESGRREVVWRGKDEADRQVAAGVYFYRLTAGSYSEMRRMVLVK